MMRISYLKYITVILLYGMTTGATAQENPKWTIGVKGGWSYPALPAQTWDVWMRLILHSAAMTSACRRDAVCWIGWPYAPIWSSCPVHTKWTATSITLTQFTQSIPMITSFCP